MPIPIIILNWNGLEDTKECIASIEQQSYQDFVIHLLDNGSKPEEVATIKKLYENHEKVQLHFSPENLGFTLGNNLILRQLIADGTPKSYVILLNNDTQLTPNWLENLLLVAQENQADMVASKMVNYYDRDKMDNAGHQLLNTLEVLPLGHDESVDDYSEVQENIGPCAGAGLYSIDMLKHIGLFDEHFRNGYEDVEIGLRAIVCGYKSVFAPDAVVYHKVSRSINKIRDFEYTLNIQRHIYYIITKLIPTPALLACLPFLLFRTLAALLLNLLFFRWKFLRIQCLAILRFFTKDYSHFLQARTKFFRSYQIISSYSLIQKMDFFLKKDLQRFYKYFVRKDKMVFEKYD